MKKSNLYNIAPVVFLLLSCAVFSHRDYYLLGIPTVNLFMVLIVITAITAFISLRKNNKSVVAWIVAILTSVIIICMILFISLFKMKM